MVGFGHHGGSPALPKDCGSLFNDLRDKMLLEEQTNKDALKALAALNMAHTVADAAADKRSAAYKRFDDLWKKFQNEMPSIEDGQKRAAKWDGKGIDIADWDAFADDTNALLLADQTANELIDDFMKNHDALNAAEANIAKTDPAAAEGRAMDDLRNANDKWRDAAQAYQAASDAYKLNCNQQPNYGGSMGNKVDNLKTNLSNVPRPADTKPETGTPKAPANPDVLTGPEKLGSNVPRNADTRPKDELGGGQPR